MTRTVVLFLIAFILAPAPAPAADQPVPHVWFVDSLIKIFPGDAAGSHRLTRPELIAARPTRQRATRGALIAGSGWCNR